MAISEKKQTNKQTTTRGSRGIEQKKVKGTRRACVFDSKMFCLPFGPVHNRLGCLTGKKGNE